MELTQLRLAMELITARTACEGHNGVGILVQNVSSFMEGFNDIVGGLTTFFNAAPPTAFLPNNYKGVEKTLHGVNYAAINTLGMPVPEGFKGDMVGYANYLIKSTETCAFVNVLLDDIYKLVSVCLTNPNMPQETSLPSLQKAGNHDVEKVRDEASIFLDPNLSNSTLPYGKIIRRNSDWSLVVHNTDSLKTVLARIDKRGMLDRAKKLDATIEKLIQQRKNKPEFIIDTAWLKYVAEHTYLIAVYLEFTAVTYYRCLAYFQSVDGISQKLIAATKEK